MASSPASSTRPQPSGSVSSSCAAAEASSSSLVEADLQEDRRKAVQKVLQQCLRALEVLGEESDSKSDSPSEEASTLIEEEEMEEAGELSNRSPTDTGYETDEIRDLLKSRVESPDFLDKIGSLYQVNPDEAASWSIINKAEAWEVKNFCGDGESDQDGFVLVKQEDIVEGIACFMAAYLLSLKETKDLTPNELQKVLSKTFEVKKKKSRIRKAWDGANVVYNVASWSATAIGIYQNPALVEAARTAVFTSWQVLSKLL